MPAELEMIDTNTIQNKVYTLRGQQVMLDSDLAQLYGYEVKRLNEQVKRNINRFPEDFMFQLTREEVDLVKSQIATSPNDSLFSGQDGGRRKFPYAFTEQGVYMLATVLKGELAEQQSIFIMRAFREMRQYIQQNQQLVTRNEMQALTHHIRLLSDRQQAADSRMDIMQQSIDALAQNFSDDTNIKEWVFLQGEKFDADAAYITIYSRARHSIFIIDDYVNTKTLQLLAKKQPGVDAILFTGNKCRASEKLSQAEITDFHTQYPTLRVKPNSVCHDRFIILDYGTDAEELYICGSSSKDAGSKVCTINKIEQPSLLHSTLTAMLAEADITL